MATLEVLFAYFFSYFLLKKKVGKENFRRSLRVGFLGWHSQRLFYTVLLDSCMLFHRIRSGCLHIKFFLLPFSFKKKEVATHKVLFVYFFSYFLLKKKVGEKNFRWSLRVGFLRSNAKYRCCIPEWCGQRRRSQNVPHSPASFLPMPPGSHSRQGTAPSP